MEKTTQEKILSEATKVTTTGTIGGVAAVTTVVGAKAAVGASIPTLMSTFATVVPGVGSIMPAWIGPMQAFAVGGSLLSAPVVVSGVAIGAGGYGAYRGYNYYYSDKPTEDKSNQSKL